MIHSNEIYASGAWSSKHKKNEQESISKNNHSTAQNDLWQCAWHTSATANTPTALPSTSRFALLVRSTNLSNRQDTQHTQPGTERKTCDTHEQKNGCCVKCRAAENTANVSALRNNTNFLNKHTKRVRPGESNVRTKSDSRKHFTCRQRRRSGGHDDIGPLHSVCQSASGKSILLYRNLCLLNSKTKVLSVYVCCNPARRLCRCAALPSPCHALDSTLHSLPRIAQNKKAKRNDYAQLWALLHPLHGTKLSPPLAFCAQTMRKRVGRERGGHASICANTRHAHKRHKSRCFCEVYVVVYVRVGACVCVSYKSCTHIARRCF